MPIERPNFRVLPDKNNKQIKLISYCDVRLLGDSIWCVEIGVIDRHMDSFYISIGAGDDTIPGDYDDEEYEQIIISNGEKDNKLIWEKVELRFPALPDNEIWVAFRDHDKEVITYLFIPIHVLYPTVPKNIFSFENNKIT